jgi:peptidyl-prolyl cis-trans isomerase C
MKQGLALLFVAAALNPVAFGQARQADPPLVVNGDLSLTTLDFEAYMQRVPPGRRDEFRAEFERINPTVDGLWVRRMLAAKARQAGLDKDPLLAARVRQAQEDVLSDAYLAQVSSKVIFPNLDARALEIYKTNQKSYMTPELIKVQHILVGLTGRTREEAAARAKQIHAEATGGKEDFLALAGRYSDEPAKAKTGEAPAMPPSSYEKPIPDVLARLKNPGDISEPVETKYGFHIFKLVGRQEPRVRPFDEVKEALIGVEKQKLIDDAKAEAVESVRADPKTYLHLDNVQALKSDFKMPDAEALSKMKPTIRY